MKNPEQYPRTEASFTSPIPRPFVIRQVTKNRIKKKNAESKCSGIFEGTVNISYTNIAMKKPNVRKLGIFPMRTSQKETIIRYKRQIKIFNTF